MDVERPPEPDLWGRVLREIHAGSTKPVAIRRDDGHLNQLPDYPHRYFHEDLPAPQVEMLESLSGRVLDLGCGPGRHLLWLQERGVEAVGIDSSPGAVEVARARGCRDVHAMQAGELDFPEASFDAAIMLGNNLGIAGTVEGSEHMFASLSRIVRPGGLLLGEGRDPLRTDRPEHLAYHAANRAAGRPPGQVCLRIEYDGAVGEWFWLLLFEAQRIKVLLKATGWAVREIRTPPHSPAYLVVARAAPF